MYRLLSTLPGGVMVLILGIGSRMLYANPDCKTAITHELNPSAVAISNVESRLDALINFWWVSDIAESSPAKLINALRNILGTPLENAKLKEALNAAKGRHPEWAEKIRAIEKKVSPSSCDLPVSSQNTCVMFSPEWFDRPSFRSDFPWENYFQQWLHVQFRFPEMAKFNVDLQVLDYDGLRNYFRESGIPTALGSHLFSMHRESERIGHAIGQWVYVWEGEIFFGQQIVSNERRDYPKADIQRSSEEVFQSAVKRFSRSRRNDIFFKDEIMQEGKLIFLWADGTTGIPIDRYHHAIASATRSLIELDENISLPEDAVQIIKSSRHREKPTEPIFFRSLAESVQGEDDPEYAK